MWEHEHPPGLLMRLEIGTALPEGQSGPAVRMFPAARWDSLAVCHYGDEKQRVVDAWYGTPHGNQVQQPTYKRKDLKSIKPSECKKQNENFSVSPM